MPLFLCAVAALWFIFAAPVPVAAQQLRQCELEQNLPAGESYTRICLEAWNVNRTYSVSTEAPIANALDKAGAADTLRAILGFIEREHLRVVRLAAQRHTMFNEPTERACNAIDIDTPLNNVNQSLSRQGWGLVGDRCVTELVTSPEETPAQAMSDYLDRLNSTRRQVVDQLGFGWQNPDVVSMHHFRSATNKCRLWHFATYRIDGKWALNTGYTNERITKFLPDWSRVYLAETVRVDDAGRVVALPKLMRKRNAEPYVYGAPYITDFVPGTTTHTATWGGVPAGSDFRTNLYIANNPALLGAIAVGAATIEQIESATTTSGMAILIVPILLTIVPISMFTEVDTRALLFYVLATDILVVLPLMIKGIELIRYTATKSEATRTWVYSGIDPAEAAVVETWHAKCDAIARIAIIGWVFAAMAVIFMVLGVAIELVAAKYYGLTRRRRQGIHSGFLAARNPDCDCEKYP